MLPTVAHLLMALYCERCPQQRGTRGLWWRRRGETSRRCGGQAPSSGGWHAHWVFADGTTVVNWRRDRNAVRAVAVAELREREDSAPRLHGAVPRLNMLRLQIQDDPASGQAELPTYVKLVVVATAPAHFEIHCLEPNCDGYHNLTDPIMAGLLRGRPHFSGESHCQGLVAGADCGRVLVFHAEAEYEDAH